MKKPITYPMLLLIPVLLMVVMVSCNQAADKNPDNGNNADTIKISTELSLSSDNEDKKTTFDSIVKPATINLEADTYILDCDNSQINWYCVTHTGYVKFKKGKVFLADGNIVDGNFEICMDSINDVDIDYQLMKEVLVNTLKSEDFFDIKKFPLANFDMVRVKNNSDNTYEVVGNLTVKNITNQIRFNSNIQFQDSLIVVESERFAIDRTKWGLTIYSENFEQTDKSFLFTDLVEIQILLQFRENYLL
ncbi:MAG: hypothetical protein DRI95_13855 [Bacteroidetes bacterium]|nr:MAG: hypothetical protein DRI95_13855 [Bacteroidota bacterium]